MAKEVVLTGLRSNDEFHLGNYLGAILPMVELQKKNAGRYQLNMFIPDLHSFITPIDHGKLHQQTMQNLKVFVASGLDIHNPDTFIYRQSYIPAHSELTWILDCFTHYNELHRMTQFKEKAGLNDLQKEELVETMSQRLENQGIWEQINQTNDLQEQKRLLDVATKPFIDEIRYIVREKGEQASMGLLNYPVLMAADILLYHAQWVPVGDDQRQHLELTRNLAIRMNNRFGHLFSVPHEWSKQLEFFGLDKGVRIRSLRNPVKKMSKSLDDPSGTIMLTDSPADAAKKILSATTDSEGSINYDFERQPGVANLLQILALTEEQPQTEVNSQWQGKSNYGELKDAVAAAVSRKLGELQSRIEAVDEKQVLAKLVKDEAEMAEIANRTLYEVQKAVGLRPSSDDAKV